MANENDYLIPNVFRTMGFNVSSDAEYKVPANYEMEIEDDVFVKYNPVLSSGEMTKVIVPSGIKEIGKEAFSGPDNSFNDYMEGCIVPDGVEIIGKNAFSLCRALRQVSLPSSLKMIDNYTFSFSGLSEIVLPEGLLTIGEGAFEHCRSLTHLRIPSTVITVGERAFYLMGVPLWGGGGEVEIEAPSTLKKHYDQDYLDSLFGGINVIWYEVHAKDCKTGSQTVEPVFRLEDVLLYQKLEKKYTTESKDGAYLSFKSSEEEKVLKEAAKIAVKEFPSQITVETMVLSYETFSGRNVFHEFTDDAQVLFRLLRIPGIIIAAIQLFLDADASAMGFLHLLSFSDKHIKKTREYVLYLIAHYPHHKDALLEAYNSFANVFMKNGIPDQLTDSDVIAFMKKGYALFSDPAEIRNSDIIDSASKSAEGKPLPSKPQKNKPLTRHFRDETVIGPVSDKDKEIKKKSPVKKQTDIMPYIFKNDEIYKKYNGSETTVVVPEGIKAIGKRAFAGNTAIEKVILPESLIVIEASAFSECSNLEEVNLPDSIEDIGKSAFKNCVKLKQVIIPGNTFNIWNGTFQGCKGLEYILMHENVDYISSIYGETPFDGSGKFTLITVKGSYADKVASRDLGLLTYYIKGIDYFLPHGAKWPVCSFSPLETQLRKDEKICGDELIQYSGSMETYVVPSYIKTIGRQAFYNNTAIKHILLPNSVNAIKDSAFYGCKKLESIEIPYGVKVINQFLFDGCSSLQYVTISESVTKIDYKAFDGCPKLKSVNFPSTLSFINKEAFPSSVYLEDIKKSLPLTEAMPDLIIYGKEGTIAQQYAEAINMRFQPGLPKGIPVPRTVDSPDPTTDAYKKVLEWRKSEIKKEKERIIQRKKQQEQAAIEQKRRKEEEFRQQEARRIAEQNRINGIRQQISNLQSELQHQETLISQNKAWFGEKARIRKTAIERAEQIRKEIQNLQQQL